MRPPILQNRTRFNTVAFGLAAVFVLALTAPLGAAPRLASDGTLSCVECHYSPQGRGLLNRYGRGIDMEQSFSERDFSGELMGYLFPKYADGKWKGSFGNVVADVVVTGRFDHEFDANQTDPKLAALYRQILFFGPKKKVRINSELGYRDTGLADTRLGPHLTAAGGDRCFIKKLALEWQLNANSQLSIGRDYLPIGLQIDDHTSYILHLNRNGIYDFPLQVKYFSWNENSQGSAYLYGPSFDEEESNREYGAGGLYERHLSPRLAVGVQGVLGFGDESDRLRLGGYMRWGISSKWALLAELDYTRFWDTARSSGDGDQVTAFLQAHYKHTEWLVSSLTGNFAHSDLLSSGDSHFSARYTLNARLNRNLSIGVSCTMGDIRRNLADGQEGTIYATFKF